MLIEIVALWIGVILLTMLLKQPADKVVLESLSGQSKKSNKDRNASNDSYSDAGISKTNQTKEFMQCACNEASMAESAAACTAGGAKSSRSSAAAAAQNHADAAQGWADKATASAGGGPPEAANAALSARNAANRARSAANRAKYNASM